MQRYRVLAVEDDPGNRNVLANVFRFSGCIDGVFEEDGAAILRLVHAGAVDLVLMDITLANSTLHGEPIDGLELTRQIKKAAVRTEGAGGGGAGGGGVPVVLVTGHCMAGDADRFLNASGADAYIAKPLRDVEGFIVWLTLTIEEYRARNVKAAIVRAP